MAEASAGALLVILSQVPPGYHPCTVRAAPEQLYYQVETLVFGRAVECATRPERFIVGCADAEQAAAGGVADMPRILRLPDLADGLRERRTCQDQHQFLSGRVYIGREYIGRNLRTGRRRLGGYRSGLKARQAHRPQALSQPGPRPSRRKS